MIDLRDVGLTQVAGRGSAHDVAAQIGAAIQRGDLRLGDRLPVERAIAEQLAVSRTTVRKGLERLRETGVIEVRTGRGRLSGTFVRSEAVPTDLVPVDHVAFEAIADVLSARRLLEPNIAQLAGQTATERDLDGLRQVLYKQIRAGEDAQRIRELDPSFHIALARATHNDAVVALEQTLLERLQLSRIGPKPTAAEPRETIILHQQTIDAIASRDPVRIAVTMRRHLRMLEQAWEAHTGRQMPAWPEPVVVEDDGFA
jgi:GntR family transcriptional repressor for pyruvate dehydrogenase complex